MSDKYVIGIDYGTDSVRGLIVNANNGEQVATSVSFYQRWKDQLFCDPSKNRFRQHPKDFIEGLELVVNDCVKIAGDGIRNNIVAISFATTGSTPCPVDEKGTPLALLSEFKEDPDAMFNLWKDHTSIKEAEEFNVTAQTNDWDYLKYVGGAYSPEWYWAKLLHTVRINKRVAQAAYTWIEHSDWMSFLLTGGTDAAKIKRNVCAAGHKGLWAEEFGGLPPISFFQAVDPLLEQYVKSYGNKTYTTDSLAGRMTKEWTKRLNLPENVAVGMGAIDAHVGAVGGGINAHEMTKVMGTSTCDMVVVPNEEMRDLFIKGISGQVNGSIVPGMVGLEAGQSAFGDVYRWFLELLTWTLDYSDQFSEVEPSENFNRIKLAVKDRLLNKLSEQAAQIPLSEDSEFALDWFNGRRTPDLNPDLKGLIGGLTLGSSPAAIYRALVEATCFGSRAIMESIEEQGVKIETVNAVGGIAEKSDFVMQMMADILKRPVRVIKAKQTVAIGAAMFASVSAGLYKEVKQAARAMNKGEVEVYQPREDRARLLDRRYTRYKSYGNFQ